MTLRPHLPRRGRPVSSDSNSWVTLWWVTATPLGPRWCPRCKSGRRYPQGPAPASPSRAGLSKRGVVDIDGQQIAPGQPRPQPGGGDAAIGAASASMNSIRAAGSPGSIGTYAAPVLRTATIATIASADRDISSATHSRGPHLHWPAGAPTGSRPPPTSRYVIERPSKLSATASGARATCAAPQHRNRHRQRASQ